MKIKVLWGNKLDVVADLMFNEFDGEKVAKPEDVFKRRRCIVIPNRIMQYWLQHQYLYRNKNQDLPRVLTNCDFPLLNVFVNDWLYRMDHPEDKERDPSNHPFASESLRWRIYKALNTGGKAFGPLTDYLKTAGKDPRQSDRRRFKLAGRLAALFDEYTVYRPGMLASWENGENKGLPDHDEFLKWEPELWRQLAAGDVKNQTYLSAFQRMSTGLDKCGIANEYSQIIVFGVSMMPRVYLIFFDLLSELKGIKVDFYLFNPCRIEWFEELSPGELERAQRRLRLEGVDDPEALFEPGNPFLGSTGRGCRDFLAEVLDLSGGMAEAGAHFKDLGRGEILHAVQSSILDNKPLPKNPAAPDAEDNSVQVHVCHGPMREVEVLRDHLLRWFTGDTDLQPRHVQVQVSDMAKYAPYIDAVFATQAKDAANTIPYVIADRVLSGESVVAEAFMRLLELADSRFPAPEVMDLLNCESVREAFGFEDHDLEEVKGWIASAGVRWGRDAAHRQSEVKVEFPEFTTWRYGLDRLLAGYALGVGDKPGLAAMGAGSLSVLPCDCVEGDGAEMLGRLARFIDCLGDAADVCKEQVTTDEWACRLDELVAMFFSSTNDTYKDVAIIRGAVEALKKSSAAAGLGNEVKMPVEVIRDFVKSHLQEVIGGDDLVQNAVVFSALRPGSSVPRRIMCLLGMGDGMFPRSDNRPAYDLFRTGRKRGDRSLRIEDRLAFLEAVSSAGERLHVSYTGYASGDNEKRPPSVLVKEFCEYLAKGWGNKSYLLVDHRLQPFHQDYFLNKSALFSYSGSNCQAASELLAASRGSGQDGQTLAPVTPPSVTHIELKDLIDFFRNPAKAYYREVLDVRLEPKEESALADSEEFDPGALAGFAVNSRIVEELVGAKPPGQEAVFADLSERGLVPLANWGLKWFGERWKELQALLEAPVKGLGELKAALIKQQNGQKHFCEVDLEHGITVSGEIAGFNGEDGSLTAVDFRAVTPRGFGRLASWIRHVFVCSANVPGIRFWVEGKTAEGVESIIFHPLAGDEAIKILTTFACEYMRGRTGVLPFMPNTSYAFAESYGKAEARNAKAAGKKDGDAGRPPGDPMAEGIEAARKKWFSNEFNSHNDDSDPYLRIEFGSGGPFRDKKAFAQMALRLIGPLLDNIGAGENRHG